MKRILILIISAILTSCGGVSNKVILEALNNNSSIPTTYLSMIILDSERGFWIGNTHLYNSGGNWNLIESQGNVSRVHNLIPPTLHDIAPNVEVTDQNGKSVYIYSHRSCRGCTLCYQKLLDAKLIEYNILKGTVGERDNLLISTALTPEGEKYRLISEQTELMRDNEKISFLRIAEYKFTKIKSHTVVDDTITGEAEYFVEFTPIAKALGYKNSPIMTTEFKFDKATAKFTFPQ